MADILKITTPLVNKNQQVQPNSKQPADPSVPFDLQDITKVVKPNAQGELLKQNNGMIEQDQAPTLLMNLMKDPSVTVNFLKNIFMLQEIIKLLPVNNQPITQEIEQLFDSLLINPEDIIPEMLRQENTSTSFRGDLFDFLRDLASRSPHPELRGAVANLLKSINSFMGKQDVLDAIANNLQFLSDSLEPSKSLSRRLYDLSDAFRSDVADQAFRDLKGEVFKLLEEVESSILYSPKMEKIVAMTIYNLSRFNDNPDFFQEAVSNLLLLLNGREQKTDFLTKVKDFLDMARDMDGAEGKSKIIDILAKIIGKQSEDATIKLLNSEKIEKIVHSLLSSPTNFTPLLHFVIPVQFQDVRSFAELWINPNGEEDERGNREKAQRNIHMLIVFDIEGIGQFEAELLVRDYSIDLALLCPPGYVEAFSDMPGRFMKGISGSPYQFGDIRIDKLDHPRSLIEVFKSLPYKRTGVDVKI